MKNYKIVDTNTRNIYWYDTIDEVILFLSNIDIDWRIFSNIDNYQHGLKCFKEQVESKFNQTIFNYYGVIVTNMRRDNNLNILFTS